MLTTFLKGVATGAFIAFPIGPIGIICLRRLITQGPAMGLASGLGAATADFIYSTISLVGLTLVSNFLHTHIFAVRIFFGLFLCGLGTVIASSSLPASDEEHLAQDALESYVSTFFLTLANPLLILSFVAVFAWFDVEYPTIGMFEVLSASLGVFVGSTLWWIILGGISTMFPPKFSHQKLKKINTIAGICIALFGIGAIISAFLSV